MRTNRKLSRILLRTAAIVSALLFGAGNLNSIQASGAPLTAKEFPVSATLMHDGEHDSVHQPLATVGVTLGQTARINVVNSPDPNSSVPPGPVTVEMCFHDTNGQLIVDRSMRPVQKTATIETHQGDFLDLNANLVARPGARVVIIPCVRILRISEGALAVPTLELFNNLIKTTLVLSPGTARGFDPQPDPPANAELAFGLVAITQGVTVRLYVLNADSPDVIEPLNPITVEIEFNDAGGNVLLDRIGRPAQKVLTLESNQAGFLELNGNDVATAGARVGIIPCVKVLRGSPGSLVTPTFETYLNLTQQTLMLSNFTVPHAPPRTAGAR